jgi:MFS family permease
MLLDSVGSGSRLELARGKPAFLLMAGRIDRRNALLGLSALLLISTMICALADSFWLMLVGHDRDNTGRKNAKRFFKLSALS